MTTWNAKTDNRHDSLEAKLEMRRRVVAEMAGRGAPARVLEAFGGVDGVLSKAWTEAELLETIDLKYRPWDGRRRYIGDNVTVMRAIDLGRFNVFDLDAYGMPWTQLRVIERRRRWAPGEIGALVLTDGGENNLRWGGPVPLQLAHFASVRPLPRADVMGAKMHRRAMVSIHRAAVATYLKRNGLGPLRRWEVQGSGGGMVYSAVVFAASPAPRR